MTDATIDTGITLVLGSPNSGKRGLALEWWQERLDDRPLIVMPTAPDARDMSAEMARRTGGSVGRSLALTFAGLVQCILRRPCRFMGEFERAVIVTELLHDTSSEALGAVAHLPGVVGATAKLLAELSECGKTNEQVEALLGRWAVEQRASAALARDVLHLVRGYQGRLLELGLCDQASAIREAMEMESGPRRPVALCGFTSFTRGQRALIERLSHSTQVLVTLNHERELGQGLCAPGEAEWWIDHAREVLEVSPRTRAYASAAIARLERHFLGAELPPPASQPQNEGEGAFEGVRFLLSSGRRAEAESVAEHIAKLIDSGFDPGGIAVVVRQVRAWSRLLGDVFASCGIPYQADVSSRLGETGLGYAFLRAVRGVATDDVDALLSFLHSPYSGVSVEDVCDLETRYRQGMGRGTRALSLLADRRMAEVLGQVQGLIVEGRAAPAAEAASGAAEESPTPPRFDPTAALVLAERMLRHGAVGLDVGCRDLEADARAYTALQGALSVMGSLGGREVPEEALRLLARLALPAASHADPRAVQIISAQRARARRFDAVFVLGLVEGEFPGLPEAPSLLSAAERASLDRLGGGLFPPEPEGERALFVGAATRAWRLLYLSARDAEDSGGEAVPSRFWVEAKTLLGAGADGHKGRTLADQVFASHSASSLRHYLRACAAEGGPAPEWRRATPSLVAPSVLAELAAVDCFSPSALESYERCPFAWFVERVVGREELETELDGRALGDLIHAVLSECYRSLAADGLLPLTSGSLAEAERRADALIDEVVEGPDCPGTPGERRVAACRLRGMARRLFKAEADAGGLSVFRAAEVRVGDPEGVDIGGLRIRGRVDRIDASTSDDDGLLVLDYKSGAAPSAAAIGTGEALQLPLYLLALGAEGDGGKMMGGAYVSLAEGALTGVVREGAEALLGRRAGRVRALDEDEWQELVGGALRTAQEAAAGMLGGVISPRREGDCPAWCSLGPVCRSRHGGQRL